MKLDDIKKELDTRQVDMIRLTDFIQDQLPYLQNINTFTEMEGLTDNIELLHRKFIEYKVLMKLKKSFP